jgi:hypothetical protein
MFFFLSFLFFLLQNQRTQRQNKSCPGRRAGISGRGEVMRKGGRRVKKCIHMHVNAKMMLVETIPGIWGGEDKGER